MKINIEQKNPEINRKFKIGIHFTIHADVNNTDLYTGD